MENTKLIELDELLLSDDGILVALRLREGLNLNKIESLCKLLEEFAVEWKNVDYIPKKAADIFVDFYPAIESVCGFYTDEEQIVIMNAADKIMDLIRESLRSN